MKTNVLLSAITVGLLAFSKITFCQAPTLGTVANFVLFSTDGAVTNTGVTRLTGDVGTNSGSSTGFGNVNGIMENDNGASAQAAADLLIAYHQLNNAIPGFHPAPLLGNGQILTAGVYNIASAATLNGILTLNAQGDPSAVFIFQIQGSFSTSAASKVELLNGALACNVFWKTEGLVSMAAGTTMRGTIIANNAAITMYTGDTLEGRALSTTGAVTVNGLMAYTPIGCGSAVLAGPAAPALASTECYAIFSSSGAVSNSGVTHVTGDVGTNVGLTTGFNTAFVTGTVHAIPDASTAQCAADLHVVYNYLNTLPYDIELLYPAQFGNGLVLTPHTYLLNAATVLTDTVFLNAEGNANAVFVIKINGALSTSTYSMVQLINGAQAKNVFWKIEGAAGINNYSVFNGTMVVNNGSLGALNTGVVLNGRALTTTGALTCTAITAIMPAGCSSGPPSIVGAPVNETACNGGTVSFIVNAQGSGLSYQWRKGSVNLSNTGNITGANAAILTINPVGTADVATNYNVIISGSVSPNDTSSNVSLLLDIGPNITTYPADETACIGNPASFSVVATGTGLSYKWRKGTVNLSDGGNVSGSNSSVLTINPVAGADTSSDYNVIVSGACQLSDTSLSATLGLCSTGIISIASNDLNKTVSIYPNPFSTSINIGLNDLSKINNCEVRVYNILGSVVMSVKLTQQLTVPETGNLPAGIYFYNVISNNKTVQAGKLISLQ